MPAATAIETVERRHQSADIEATLERLLHRTVTRGTPARIPFKISPSDQKALDDCDRLVEKARLEVEKITNDCITDRKRDLRSRLADLDEKEMRELAEIHADQPRLSLIAGELRSLRKLRLKSAILEHAALPVGAILDQIEEKARRMLSEHLSEGIEDARALGIDDFEPDQKAERLADSIVVIRRTKAEVAAGRDRRQPKAIVESFITQ